MRSMSRHSPEGSYNERHAEQVLEDLRRGLNVTKLCAERKLLDPTFPSWRQVFDWLAHNDAFAQAYARAKVVGCEAVCNELFVIGDDNSGDGKLVISEKTGELVTAIDHEHINRSRLRIDVRKWYLSKIVPKIYGDRLELEHKGDVNLLARLSEGRQRAAIEDATNAALEGEFTQVTEGSDLV